MVIAFIADIHANLPALQAVLAAIPAQIPIFCAGDLVGYGAEPHEVITEIRQWAIPTVIGNHDAMYLPGGEPADPQRREQYAFDYGWAQLQNGDREYLAALPVTVSHPWGVMSHGQRDDYETYLQRDAETLPDQRLGLDELLVVGHTHRPMWRRQGQGFILNPGSVGQPREWASCDNRASFALVSDQPFGIGEELPLVEDPVSPRFGEPSPYFARQVLVEYGANLYADQLEALGFASTTVAMIRGQRPTR